MFWRKIEGKMTAEKDYASHLEIANRSGKNKSMLLPYPHSTKK